jgi:hypothetical protein
VPGAGGRSVSISSEMGLENTEKTERTEKVEKGECAYLHHIASGIPSMGLPIVEAT